MTLKELKNIAPILASLQDRGTGFTIPDTYFDTLETSVIREITSASLPKNTGYIIPKDYFISIEEKVFTKLISTIEHKPKVPDGYFDTIEDVVISRIEREKQAKVFSLAKYWKPIAIAASLALVFILYNPFNSSNNKEVAEITQWIEAGHLDLESYEIAEYFQSELESLELENTINTESLENYLLEEISEESFYN